MILYVNGPAPLGGELCNPATQALSVVGTHNILHIFGLVMYKLHI
jgi:hypothetical protein